MGQRRWWQTAMTIAEWTMPVSKPLFFVGIIVALTMMLLASSNHPPVSDRRGLLHPLVTSTVTRTVHESSSSPIVKGNGVVEEVFSRSWQLGRRRRLQTKKEREKEKEKKVEVVNNRTEMELVELHVFQPEPDRPHLRHAIGSMLMPIFDDKGRRIVVRHEMHDATVREDFLRRHGSECQPKVDKKDKKKSKVDKTKKEVNVVLERYLSMSRGGGDVVLADFRTELWKYCALYLRGGLYLEGDGVLLQPLNSALVQPKSSSVSASGSALPYNVAPASSVHPDTVHGSILGLRGPRHPIARGMLDFLVSTPDEVLAHAPLAVSRKLHDLVLSEVEIGGGDDGGGDGDGGGEKSVSTLSPGTYDSSRWRILGHSCHFDDPEPPPHSAGGSVVGGAGEEKGDGRKRRQERRRRSRWEPGMPRVMLPRQHRMTQHCPASNEYCCHISSSSSAPSTTIDAKDEKKSLSSSFSPSMPIFLTMHPISPHRTVPPADGLPQPYAHRGESKKEKKPTKADGDQKETNNSHLYIDSDVPHISTVRDIKYKKPKDHPSTPNFYDQLDEGGCLPMNKACSTCLRNKEHGADCVKCGKECPCFCSHLCKTRPPPKFVSKRFEIQPPPFPREVDGRIIPRIIHQTWFEPVLPEEYPNMSRLIQSWRQSGWEYRFYDDDAMENFLSTHFPPEVRMAYDSLIPGAFRADLFRYCVLLVHGGVYADMDVLLESDLEASIPRDVGFLSPVDEPGNPVGHRMCIWNGLLASAPAHPFLARVIQIVVNNVRNRFTSVDVDDMLCGRKGSGSSAAAATKTPELSVSHSYDTLFTAGPCILGMAINSVLGRDLQHSFQPGEVRYRAKDLDGGSTAGAGSVTIPGRTVILRQDKEDMGAHRFTLVESNLIVAATDMPDYDDRHNLGKQAKKKSQSPNEDKKKQKKGDAGGGDGGCGAHYSNAHVQIGVYGLTCLYKEGTSADEDINLIVVPADRQADTAVSRAAAASNPSR